MHCVAYSPLGGQGSLFPNDLKERDAVARVARETGKSAAQVLLKWNLQRGVAVIPKASSEAHLRENLAGCFEWRLSNEHKVQAGRGGPGGRRGQRMRRGIVKLGALACWGRAAFSPRIALNPRLWTLAISSSGRPRLCQALHLPPLPF